MSDMKRVYLSALLSGACLGAAHAQVPFPPLPQAHNGATVTVFASGLHDPRGMALSPDGELYVAEAGTTQGIFVPPPPPPPNEPPTRTRCEVYWPVGPATPGYTGRISRISQSGNVSVVADQLPSVGLNALIGGDRMSVGALAFQGPRLYAILAGGGCSHGHPSEPNALLRVLPNGTTIAMADLGNYLRGNPDSKNPADGDFEPDGTWYSLVSAFGAMYAVEPNHGVLVRIDRLGGITLVADLIAATRAVDAVNGGDQTYTALTRHGNSLYVGTLGRIDTDFRASVFSVSPDGSQIKRVASGLHGVVGIAFDRLDRMYVLETTQAGVAPPLSDPTAGRLVRVEKDGSLTPILTGIAFPTAVLAGRHGELYVTNCGYHCDDRAAFPPRLTSLQAGQILKVTLPDLNSRDDSEGDDEE